MTRLIHVKNKYVMETFSSNNKTFFSQNMFILELMVINRKNKVCIKVHLRFKDDEI